MKEKDKKILIVFLLLSVVIWSFIAIGLNDIFDDYNKIKCWDRYREEIKKITMEYQNESIDKDAVEYKEKILIMELIGCVT